MAQQTSVSSKSKRKQEIQNKKRRERFLSNAGWGSLGIAAAVLVGILIWQVTRPPTGEEIPVPASYRTHIQEGTPPGPYPSDPPAGGVHYGSTFEARFYEQSELESLSEYPEGYLVHNLEHGYVIFWYNCATLDETGCTRLKSGIQQVMADYDGLKLIAFPWQSLDVPVVMTSWGKLQRFNRFNAAQASAFIDANRNRSPEPNAP